MIPITDTHQHLIEPMLGDYSWTNGISKIEGRKFDYDNYLAEIAGCGITKTVFMETTPDAWQEEAPYIYEISERPGSLVCGVIANCHPEEDGFDAYLDAIQSDKLVGLRRICHVEPDDFSCQTKFVENVRRIAQRGLTFDLCFLERQLPIAFEFAKSCPEIQFILDHCGIPDIAGGQLDPWRGYMRDLSALPNIACKISGIPAYCKPGDATIETVRPYFEHSIECFGWDRVVWGGDWPVCTLTTPLSQWTAISREIVRGASQEEQSKLFNANAARIYGIK